MIKYLLVLCCWFTTAQAVEVFKIQDNFRQANLDKAFLFQQNAAEKPEELSEQWQAMPTFGFATQRTPYWLKLSLHNSSFFNRTVYFTLAQPQVDTVDFWYQQKGHWLHLQSGDHYPFYYRSVADEAHIFPLQFASHENITVLIRVATLGAAALPWHLHSEAMLIAERSRSNLILGWIIGSLLALVLSLLILSYVTHKRVFTLYACFILVTTLFAAAAQGLTVRYFWPMLTGVQEYIQPLLGCVSLCLAISFCLQYYPQQQGITWRRVMVWTRYVVVGNFIIGMLLPYYMALYLAMLITIVVYGGLTAYGVQLWRANVPFSRLFTFCWATVFLGFVAGIVLTLLAVLGANYYAVLISLQLSSSVMTYILLRQLMQERDADVLAQQQILANVKAQRYVQESALKAETELREELEKSIQDRTFELEIALRELEEKNRELEEKNTLDSLTGLRNRSFFDKKLSMEHRRSRREQSYLSLVMLDIDHFKKVNDTYGHPVGDEVIRRVALALQLELKRPSDSVCRYGGEEFALILPNTPLEGAMQVAEMVRKRINAEPIASQGGLITITISCGVYTACACTELEPIDFIKHADSALYQSKEQGRNRTTASRHSQSPEA